MRTRFRTTFGLVLGLTTSFGAARCTLFNDLDELEGTASGDGTASDGAPEATADQSSDSPACGADLTSDPEHCGSCGNACAAYELCVASNCEPCDSTTTDCDQDGWLLSEGDCCDKPGGCGSEPELVNPGAIEITGNGIDDNCNGKLDLFDAEDTVPCDAGLYSNSTDSQNYARALGICRTTLEAPEQPKDRTWGLIEAELLRADGSPLEDPRARSIRSQFGSVIPNAIEGESIVVLSTGIAADGVQLDPGPNGGAPANTYLTNVHTPPSQVDVTTCTLPACISDWFAAPNPPLKAADALPTAPDCPPISGFADPKQANDSVMLRLRLRAPSNAKAVQFNVNFLSSEYPEYVCSDFNDQFIALIDTPDGTPEVANPADKNLLTYSDATEKWPVGINVAHGTGLFSICESETANPGCWDTDVAPQSCGLGASQLAGTGFEKPTTGTCLLGGATSWLTTAGNVVPGGIVEIRIVIWDVGDSSFDSTALVDGFEWKRDPVQPGTGTR